MERVLAVRKCEKTSGGGGGGRGAGGGAVARDLAKAGWWQFPNGKYAFKFERFV